jgi:hypothetical protein
MKSLYLHLFIVFFCALAGCKKEEKKQGTPSDQMIIETPDVDSVLPVGPSTDNFPVVSGTAQALTIIKLYSNSTCTTQIGIGSSTAEGTFSVIASVVDNTTTTIYAKSYSGSYASACSSTYVTYMESWSSRAQIRFLQDLH